MWTIGWILIEDEQIQKIEDFRDDLEVPRFDEQLDGPYGE